METVNKRPEILQKKGKILKTDSPTVSIIVCSKNLKKFVRDTMNSLSNQTYKNFEIIVIDGNSSDGSLDVFKEYENIRLISENDTGSPDAVWKGLRASRGKYVMECMVSDALADTDWLKFCVEYLENHPDIPLVWGFPVGISEDSQQLGKKYFDQFHKNVVPEKEDFFIHWLETGFLYPEGNLCCRKDVVLRCYPKLFEINKNVVDWIEFSYRFNSFGYFSHCIPVFANFGRTHSGQLGQDWEKNKRYLRTFKYYWRKIFRLRLRLILGIKKMNFISAESKIIKRLDYKKFTIEYFRFISQRKNFMLSVKKIIKHNFPWAKRLQIYLKKPNNIQK